MNLVHLEPRLVHVQRCSEHGFAYSPSFEYAQGVHFRCPKCRIMGSDHTIRVWFANHGVPDDLLPRERVGMNGYGLGDLTLRARLTDACGWQGYVTNGYVDSVT